MIELDFFQPKDIEGTPKLTCHKNGKMGFSKSAMDLLELAEWKYCKFAKEKNSGYGNVIYLVRTQMKDEATFNISKAGNYYYVKVRSLLTELDVDYSDNKTTTIFDISPLENNGEKIYKLTKRIIKKRDNKKAE